VYPPFLSSPTNNGMDTIQVPLTQVINKDSTFRYKIDFDAFERAITSRTKLCIFCHPHNPSGESWSVEDIRKLAEICNVHDIILCSDEIHCDLILDGSRHTPVAKAAPEFKNNLITLMAPSKTFNIPGLGYSFAIVQNDALRKKLKRVIDGPAPHPNTMGLAACEAAFTESEGWLHAVRQYIATNRDVAVRFIRENFPDFKVSSPERTYLLWIDCRACKAIDGSPSNFFLKEARVALNDGALFGDAGRGFVRLNLGAPRSRILEALSLMKQAVDNLLKK
jgi:cystathionine beta-lyase